ncbi:hypothetical protein ACOKS3_14860 [Pseudomonas sp. HS6-2]|uniref:hypothetical protein n=1 Tax=Pseudomonas sp. HS6-2 TaxID=3410986 RepID=UPI003BE4B4A7
MPPPPSWDKPLTPVQLWLLCCAALLLHALRLLMADVPFLGYALVRLLRYWFETPSLSCVLLVLPLWFQPYFLQNLSYQYDGASMALSLAAAAWEPEMLPRVGIDELHTFNQPPPLGRQQVLAASPTPQVSSRFYDIHRVGDDAYVLVKPPEGYGQ